MSSRRRYLVVAERSDHSVLKEAPLLAPEDYLEGRNVEAVSQDLTIINLCRSYEYLSRGYYISLLADARRQKVVPNLQMVEEITNPYTYFTALRNSGLETIDFTVVRGRHVLPKVIVPADAKDETAREPGPPMMSEGGVQGPVRYRHVGQPYEEVTTCFGRTLDARFRKHCAEVFKVFPFPLLKIRFYREDNRWKVGQVFPLAVNRVRPAELELLNQELSTGKLFDASLAVRESPYCIAVLMDESDAFAPSDEDTFQKLKRAGERHGVLIEPLSKDDFRILAEYNALFLRTVTGMDHYSFLFAQRAKSLGVPVIDDPQTTVRCSNKVYLHEIFHRAGLATPRTLTISRTTPLSEAEALGYPLIVKQPDGTFSAAVKKAVDASELKKLTRDMFKRSPLLTLQEFRPTEFDWRIGVLDGAVLYACKYYMAKGHWQIVRERRGGGRRYGKVEAVPIDGAPEQVRSLALEAAALIGDGLYGVDIKETELGPVIIEINDNPDIWVGEEDAVEGDRLYDAIVHAFLRRLHDVGLRREVST
ncbi:MAG: RimK family protein [Gemmatimonadota bacterium]|nr:MAG: RimK family protein [Gemmatimonadota bacterium]